MKENKVSAQSRALRRSLSLRLLLEWLVYTAVFTAIALVMNATIVQRVGNFIADSTSDWIYLDYENIPVDEALGVLRLELLGYIPEGVGSAVGQDVANTDPSTVVVENGVLYVPIEPLEHATSVGSQSTQETKYADDASITANGIDLSTVNLLVRPTDGGQAYTTSLRSLREQAIMQSIQPMNTQVSQSANGIAFRDLTTYNKVRELKWPFAICAYLIGCIIVVFAGYGRSLRYFDELEGAVEGLVRNKEKPVELSRELAITQNDLNDIRLASLADERAAKAAERRKDELVAYLAHDIKTPLTSIIGYLMLLDEAPDLPEGTRVRYIRTASERSQRLEGLIDEFFEITRYNLQAIPIEREHVNMKLFCEQVAEEFYPNCSARNLKIEVEAEANRELFIDGIKMARALGNVVRNAVAYADEGTTITISAEEQVRENDTVTTISVANSGREISDVHLKSIFEKFYREDTSRTSSSGGSGLGLAIAKEIVEAHRGSISAVSKNGITIFTIELPIG